MEDYRNNFKVEKTLKTSLVRDRARVQFGRISMFGLMELSRQRLRSSLIDKSFEKCNYCSGSGLILNSSSISDQIIKVIKEKLSNDANSTLSVKCNTVLAENLLNLKKNEIVQLENHFNSKINFYFNSQFSLHDPVIELEDDKNNINKNDETKTIKKKNKKEKIIKKTTSKKRVNVKSSKNKKVESNKDKSQEIIKSKEIDLNTNDISDENIEEKTGWWS